MFDDVLNAFHYAMFSFADELDKALDSILDDMSAEEYRKYARFGLLSALKFGKECENMDDKLITEE